MRSRTRQQRLLTTALSLLLASATTSSASEAGHSGASRSVHAKRRPAKREYDSHTYYVLELDPDSPWATQPADLARALGAEHVEQVGELQHHYLIRAETALVDRGDDDWPVARPLAKRDADDDVGGGRAGRSQRDLVLERYNLMRRASSASSSATPPHLATRRDGADHAAAVLSLERQVPSLRAKRALVVPPPDASPPLRLSPYRRDHATSPAPLSPRQINTGQGVSSSTLVADMGVLLGIQDPLWPKQWHLVNGIIELNSINVTGVWQDGIHGQGVNVAIVDDGLDMHSDDLAPNFHADGSWDYNDNTALPEPRLADDQHGTRCAGEVAAAKNDVCGVGVAYKSGIAGIRILSASISDADEASALNYGFQTNDIYSCSWGPPDDGRSMEAPGRLITKAMLNGVQNGRAGKGSIFVFASGNGGANDDQCNFDGYTNSLMSITVGAIDRKGLHPFYSEACAAIMVVTYSSGSGDSIHTTDVGKNTCTDRHGGTSAAAPIAAGIFALVLQVRPDLTWRDMQHLCVLTAVQVNPADPDWQMTASGRNFNHKYGFGKLDAWAMVNAAKDWTLVKPQTWWTSPVVQSGLRLTPEGIEATIEVTKADLKDSNFDLLEHVTVTVHIDHQRRGNVEVELDSPRGMKSILARPRRLDDSPLGIPNWTFMTVKHWDEDPVGIWTIRVRDRQTNLKNGTFNSWSMQLWGSTIDASRADLWKLPKPAFGEEDDEADADADADQDQDPAVPAPVPTTAEDAATKVYVKPTAHLPEDHKEAEGEAHETFGGGGPPSTPTPLDDDEFTPIMPTYAPGTPEPTSIGDDNTGAAEDEYFSDDSPGYLAGMSRLLGNSTWLFVAAGTIVVFVAGVSAFFLLRRRPSGNSRGGYAFAPGTDEEDGLAMRTRRTGSLRIGEGGGRTRELYDAFALEGSDSEDEGSDDDDAGGRAPKSRVRTDVAYTDKGMSSFLDDPSTPLAVSHEVGADASATEGLTRTERVEHNQATCCFAMHSNEPASNSHATLPSASFSALPVELKAKVVDFARSNDRDHGQYKQQYSTISGASSRSNLMHEIANSGRWFGRSVEALSLVDKELNVLAARYMFEHIKSRKQAKSSRLTRYIVPKYAHLIRTVTLTGDVVSMAKVLGVLDQLTNVHSLAIASSSASILFGRIELLNNAPAESSDEDSIFDYSDEDEDDAHARMKVERKMARQDAGNAAVRRATFRRTMRDVRTVTLVRFSVANAIELLKVLPGVESAFFAEVGTTWSNDPAELATLLSTAPRLREVSISGTHALDIKVTPTHLPVQWAPLTSLTLGRLVPDSDFLPFINTFSQSLTSLRLNFVGGTQSFPTPANISSPFQSLSFFHISNASAFDTSRILAWLAQPTGFPSPPLRHVDLEIKTATIFTSLPELNLALVPFHSTLERVRIVAFRTHLEVPNLDSHLHLPDHVTKVLGAPVDPFFSRTRMIQATPETGRGVDVGDDLVEKRAQVMMEALEFGIQQVQELKEVGDIVGMETALTALAPLRVWQQLVGK